HRSDGRHGHGVVRLSLCLERPRRTSHFEQETVLDACDEAKIIPSTAFGDELPLLPPTCGRVYDDRRDTGGTLELTQSLGIRQVGGQGLSFRVRRRPVPTVAVHQRSFMTDRPEYDGGIIEHVLR